MSIHKIKRKSGIRYRVMVRGFGKQYTKTFKRKVDAESWEREQLTAGNSQETAKSVPTMTFGDLAHKWLEMYASVQKSESSQRRDRQILKNQIFPAFGNKRLNEIRAGDVEAWIGHLRFRQHLGPKTCNHCLGLFRKILGDGVRWQHLTENPANYVKPVKLPEIDFQFWNGAEVEAFLLYTRDNSSLAPPIFVTALHTGMRLGELRALLWDSVDLDRRQITIKRSHCRIAGVDLETTKSKRIRRVPINSTLHGVLVSLRNDAGPYVLPRVDWEHLNRRVKDLAPKAGVKPIRFHDLRHIFASNFMMSGGNVYVLQKMLGHSSIQMTERYSHLSPEHLSGKTEILGYGSGEALRCPDIIPLRVGSKDGG